MIGGGGKQERHSSGSKSSIRLRNSRRSSLVIRALYNPSIYLYTCIYIYMYECICVYVYICVYIYDYIISCKEFGAWLL